MGQSIVFQSSAARNGRLEGLQPIKRSADWLQKHVPYAAEPTESEVQAVLYTGLKEQGINVRMEVVVYPGDSKMTVRRLDLVIYSKDNIPIQIIEVKRNRLPKSKSNARYHGRKSVNPKHSLDKQLRRYDWFGLSIKVIHGMREAQEYLRKDHSSCAKKQCLSSS